MELSGEYVPNTIAWVREQIEAYEASGGHQAGTLRGTDIPIIIVTMRGNKSGSIRKIALVRVEHQGEYALVASLAGAPKNPAWYHNLLADPVNVTVQDGPAPLPVTVRELSGDERETWWERATNTLPTYLDYQRKTERTIPVLLATPA